MLPSLVVVVHTVTRPRGIAKRLPTPVYTPAYAGKTLLSLPAASCIWGTPPRMRGKRTFRQSNSGYPEHPRVCGENVEVPTPSASAISGTPPRMRGKLRFGRHRLAPLGNTPAYAGKTQSRESSLLESPGTPPRMRGKRQRHDLASGKPRNTPRMRGKPACWKHEHSPTEEHPRVCGENRLRIFTTRWRTGTPPRMRENTSPPARLPGVTRF